MAVKIHERSDGSYRVTIRREPTTIADKLREMRWSDRLDVGKQVASDVGRGAAHVGKGAAQTMLVVAREAVPLARNTASYFPQGVLSFSNGSYPVEPSTRIDLPVKAPETWKEAFSQAKRKFECNPVASAFKGLGAIAAVYLASSVFGCTTTDQSVHSTPTQISVSAEEASEWDADRIYETEYSRVSGVGSAAEDEMRVRMEEFAQNYTTDLVSRIRGNDLQAEELCISFSVCQGAANVRSHIGGIDTHQQPTRGVIVLSAGHGRSTAGASAGYDTGTVGHSDDNANSYEEAELAGIVMSETARQLEAEGYIVVIPRDEIDNGPSMTGLSSQASLLYRSIVATRLQQEMPDVAVTFLELHFDVQGEDTRRPTMWFYSAGEGQATDSPASQAFASALRSHYFLASSQNAVDVISNSKSLAVLRVQSPAVPAVLAELGNVENSSDQVQLWKIQNGREGKTQEVARSLVDGINSYYAQAYPSVRHERDGGFSIVLKTGITGGEVALPDGEDLNVTAFNSVPPRTVEVG